VSEKEIRKLVFKKYPRTKKEIEGCLEELARNTALRDMYRERLRNSVKQIERNLE
jgi:uncharacterized protein YnzC (UPF0291/DUF896 family)